MIHRFFVRLRRFSWVIGGCICVFSVSVNCKKNTPVNKKENIVPTAGDSTHDINHVLSSSKFSLFSQIWLKGGFNRLVRFDKFFTVIAPTDSILSAAGYTKGFIDTASAAHLFKAFSYYTFFGSHSGPSLLPIPGNTEFKTLRIDTLSSDSINGSKIYQQYIFLDFKKQLAVNGDTLNVGEEPLAASNGYIYTTHKLIVAPTKSMYQTLLSLPELSNYLYACAQADSLNKNVYFSQDSLAVFLKAILAISSSSNGPEAVDNVANAYGQTLFAPTNSAFKAAGFTTFKKIKQSIDKFDPSVSGGSLFPALYYHQMHDPTGNGSTTLFFNDMLEAPNLNNDVFNFGGGYSFNQEGGFFARFATPYRLLYVIENNRVGIKWDTVGNILKHGPAHLVRKNIFTTNGVIHEVDSLFYPFVN